MFVIRSSIVESIPACHAGDPGSIPGFGDFFINKNNLIHLKSFVLNESNSLLMLIILGMCEHKLLLNVL